MNAPVGEMTQLLSLADKCLGSPRASIRDQGLLIFYMTIFRPDSSSLIKPHVEDIAPSLDAKDLAVKRTAIVILGASKPNVLPHALDLVSAHLEDFDNTRLEAGLIVAAVINARASDQDGLQTVLKFVSSHPGFKLKVDTLRLLGLNNVTVEAGLSYIREAINDPDVDVRKAALQAVIRLPRQVRQTFSQQVRVLLARPNEPSEVRSLAEKALFQE